MTVATTRGNPRAGLNGGLAARVATSRSARGSKVISHWTGPSAPWGPRDLVRSSSLMLLGMLGLGTSWFVMSGQPQWRDQTVWLVVGMGATLLCGVAVSGWLLVGTRAVHSEMADLMSVVKVEYLGIAVPSEADELETVPEPVVRAAPVLEVGEYLTSQTMTRAHRPGCALVRGKDTERITEAEVLRRGLELCGVCCK